jgi:phytoene dehydrogenase-like protein
LESEETGRRQPADGRRQSASRYDVIVIGGGVNALTCAAMLGQAGLRTLLLEQRDEVGGCATEHELAAGFRVPTLAHRTGPLRADVVEQLHLAQHGLVLSPQPIRHTALSPDGRALPIFAHSAQAAAAIGDWSARDAAAWPDFTRSLARLGHVVGSLFTRVPPDVDAPGTHDLWTLMRTLRAFRALPNDDAWRLLRWGPMAVADLVSECLETELLRATVAADGLLGAMMGPWSAGSGLQLLLHEANASVGVTRDADVVGGPAAVTSALQRAAQRHGVDLRTGAAVAQVLVRADRAVGVALESGETLEARAVVSGADPRRTFLSLCEAEHLPPEFLWRIRNLRVRGTLAKVNLALSALPAFAGATRQMLASRVRIAPDLEYLERAYDHAKYGECSIEPWVEFTVPSIANPSLAPAGAHVLSAYVQWIPADGNRQTADAAGPRYPVSGVRAQESAPSVDRAAVLDATLTTLERYAPGIRAQVVQAELITPSDMERRWGLTGGHIFHGELSLDQAFTMRPLLGWGRYQTPIEGLYLCGSGTHPGTGLTGGSGLNAARVIVDALT